MSKWVIEGLRTGVRTTRYPGAAETAPGTSPGRPRGTMLADPAAARALADRCPAGAIGADGSAVDVDHRRCVACRRCAGDDAPGSPGVGWEDGYEWAALAGDAALAGERLARAFRRSLHVRFVDAGACGACMGEARQIVSPYYNVHRLGFFVTPTPRAADVLLVAGPVSDAMRTPLRRTWEAMPAPRRVIAMGACALSGGVFGPGFACAGGVAEVVPVDVEVPGCPPPPLALVHALLLVVERKPAASPASRESRQ